MFTNLYESIKNRNDYISIIGLGYVGLPLAFSFSKVANVIGFDINKNKINKYLSGVDPTGEIGNNNMSNCNIVFTNEEFFLQKSKFHIVAVPTPIHQDKTPNLQPIENASKIIGRNLTKGSVVVYESTVYPGVTENICIPILEKYSNMKCGIDFKVGYSPERVNPGDKLHRIDNIIKIVSGIDQETLDITTKIYELIIKCGVFKASCIKVAEAAKVIENSQRDINIAFMNELSMILGKMKIDTNEVIAAMNTKFNSLDFKPGLVGGHCIGVDPYYIIYEAEKLGYSSQIISSGRKINDSMGEYIANSIIKKLLLSNKVVNQLKIVILGLTFKENCPDLRNSKVFDIINKLNEYGINPIVTDPIADNVEAEQIYGIKLTPLSSIDNADCLIFAVAHDNYKQVSWNQINQLYHKDSNTQKFIIDIKGIFVKKEMEKRGYIFWRL